jgi:hypothetical protein
MSCVELLLLIFQNDNDANWARRKAAIGGVVEVLAGQGGNTLEAALVTGFLSSLAAKKVPVDRDLCEQGLRLIRTLSRENNKAEEGTWRTLEKRYMSSDAVKSALDVIAKIGLAPGVSNDEWESRQWEIRVWNEPAECFSAGDVPLPSKVVEHVLAERDGRVWEIKKSPPFARREFLRVISKDSEWMPLLDEKVMEDAKETLDQRASAYASRDHLMRYADSASYLHERGVETGFARYLKRFSFVDQEGMCVMPNAMDVKFEGDRVKVSCPEKGDLLVLIASTWSYSFSFNSGLEIELRMGPDVGTGGEPQAVKVHLVKGKEKRTPARGDKLLVHWLPGEPDLYLSE